ncbi:sigmaY antisigma factor component [Paenibacillus sp. GSMTC-2017]|uniref:sigmaY antisigma factor component n=1 Tax=Paenibacillus sp. GSMTC-2017 TaxID=2794350 RepID=UPI0018D8867B|nr:sigmaY antisigma factor component [Paenibacillus sp. GSMTC-2017]MBH5320161.1 sigmaY antisigma factor component [Paenibacillus sp. GSMTC-2017]
MEEQLARSVWFWLLLASILISQSTWLFLDARKRGSNYWFWGIWGLIHVPTPLVVYWIVVRSGWIKRKKKDDFEK